MSGGRRKGNKKVWRRKHVGVENSWRREGHLWAEEKKKTIIREKYVC